ncbi:MAG: alpha/beta hydrolase [Bacteroidota bacterium]|nr:alpha/beta hydrolase [Bacteroidota bacterium]
MKRLSFAFLMIFSGIALNAQVTTLKVWPGKIPGAIDNPSYKEEFVKVEGQAPRVSHVVNPDITVFLPAKDKANGTAVVICPGGGYTRLAIDHEGYQVAEWLNKQGVAGIVLKYRLPSDEIMKDKTIGPLQDAQEAIRIVRRNAQAWNIDPRKVGIMGFSAGGHLASTLSTHYSDRVYIVSDTVSARPDFSVLIYPVISMKPEITHGGSRQNLLGKNPEAALQDRFSNELQVNKNTPPAFLVHATDDGTVPVQNSINYLLALKTNGVSGELHIYEKGGHGFGLGRSKGTEITWPEAFKTWLKVHNLL